jgi:Domain of unknown function (DUF4124)
MAIRLSTLAILLAMFGSLPSHLAQAQVFQWTDPGGVLHVTDNPYSIPESVRNSSLLIVRTDWHSVSGPAAQRPDPPPTPVQSSATEETESHERRSPPPQITYAPQELNIVVVHRARSHKKKPCRAGECKTMFRPDFTNRRYVHPSVFTGGSRQYIHP